MKREYGEDGGRERVRHGSGMRDPRYSKGRSKKYPDLTWNIAAILDSASNNVNHVEALYPHVYPHKFNVTCKHVK